MCKPSAVGQLTGPTQPFILLWVNKWVVCWNEMAAIYTVVVPSGEYYKVKAGMVSLQCKNCVIHTWSLQRRASQNGALYKSGFLYLFYMVHGLISVWMWLGCPSAEPRAEPRVYIYWHVGPEAGGCGEYSRVQCGGRSGQQCLTRWLVPRHRCWIIPRWRLNSRLCHCTAECRIAHYQVASDWLTR